MNSRVLRAPVTLLPVIRADVLSLAAVFPPGHTPLQQLTLRLVQLDCLGLGGKSRP